MKTIPQDLRIGNFIQDIGESDKHYVVWEITETRISAGPMIIYSAGFGIDHYIPLTPEWLERFGAIFPYKDFRCQIGELCFYWNPNGALFLNDSGYNESITDYPIDQVHKLQNLVYSLTGKELELKQ